MKPVSINYRAFTGPPCASLATLALASLTIATKPTRADETCSSPYLVRVEGQEEFVYVWTPGVEGLGDGSDKLVVLDVKPGSIRDIYSSGTLDPRLVLADVRTLMMESAQTSAKPPTVRPPP